LLSSEKSKTTDYADSPDQIRLFANHEWTRIDTNEIGWSLVVGEIARFRPRQSDEISWKLQAMKIRIPLVLIALSILCIGLLPTPKAFGVNPAPDGGYPGFNTAEGQNALLNLDTSAAFGNTAAGWFSLNSNVDTSFNTAVGAGTLFINTADENTAVGAAALLFNTTGIRNTALGSAALLNNTDDSNTAIGAEALGANTPGAFNVAIGGSALITNTAGDSNTAVGVGALDNVTGDGNTALGRLAGNGITTGNNIIAIGTLDGLSTTNGQVDDSCYIDNIIDAGVNAGTSAFVFVDQDGKLGTTALPGTGALPGAQPQAMLNELRKEQKRVAELEGTVAHLAATVKEQAAQIQKVSAQLELKKPAAKTVVNNQ
jgi:hypothetical protein